MFSVANFSNLHTFLGLTWKPYFQWKFAGFLWWHVLYFPNCGNKTTTGNMFICQELMHHKNRKIGMRNQMILVIRSHVSLHDCNLLPKFSSALCTHLLTFVALFQECSLSIYAQYWQANRRVRRTILHKNNPGFERTTWKGRCHEAITCLPTFSPPPYTHQLASDTDLFQLKPILEKWIWHIRLLLTPNPADSALVLWQVDS